MRNPTTLAQKVWDSHVVHSAADEPDLLYIDLHLVHEVTSPQAFDGLRLTKRPIRRPELTIATEDHNVPTADIHLPIADPISARQVEVMRNNAKEFGVELFSMGNPLQGIVHVIGPEQGRTLPGMTIVCGDSHTATHGAFGSLAFGIGTSEVEHVLATQTLPQSRPKWMSVEVNGSLPAGVTAKDIVYDLGCGDGRIVITAARDRGARGVGVEIDLDLVDRAKVAARQAGVADRVRIERGDLFAMDLREATVVMLYLGEDLNTKLWPKLKRELRPGTRIVSHRFIIRDVPPKRSIEAHGVTLHFWTI